VDGITPETCDECGFDARRWKVRDAASFFGALGRWWQLATEGVAAEQLNTRPAPDVWSVLEYGAHTALVTAMHRIGLGMVIDDDGVELPVPPVAPDDFDPTPAVLDPARILRDLEREGSGLAALAKAAPKEAWAHTGRLRGETVQAEAALFHCVHDASHHQFDVARGLRTLGVGSPAGAGSVVQLNVSDGGVPKLPVDAADITHDGMSGDRQGNRKHHGRPFQALCLWSADVIDELAGEGHPIAAGSAGENLTVAGLDWSALRPGTLLRIGTALTEVSFPATPCRHQTQWFTDGDFRRIDHDRNPQWTRWYAWVREPGTVATGDSVEVQPA
jgi:hypothetical protein